MLISRMSHPSSSISVVELLFVRFVVPNPGIVIPVTVSGGSPRFFTACADTRSASVESSPPDTPTTIHDACVASILLCRPATCIAKIDRHRSSLFFDGTNGVMETFAHTSFFSANTFSQFTVMYSPASKFRLHSAKDLFARRSWRIFVILKSRIRIPSSNGLISPNNFPFSYIRLCPENTISEVDS